MPRWHQDQDDTAQAQDSTKASARLDKPREDMQWAQKLGLKLSTLKSNSMQQDTPSNKSSGNNGEPRAASVRTVSPSNLHCALNEFCTSSIVSCRASLQAWLENDSATLTHQARHFRCWGLQDSKRGNTLRNQIQRNLCRKTWLKPVSIYESSGKRSRARPRCPRLLRTTHSCTIWSKTGACITILFCSKLSTSAAAPTAVDSDRSGWR